MKGFQAAEQAAIMASSLPSTPPVTPATMTRPPSETLPGRINAATRKQHTALTRLPPMGECCITKRNEAMHLLPQTFVFQAPHSSS